MQQPRAGEPPAVRHARGSARRGPGRADGSPRSSDPAPVATDAGRLSAGPGPPWGLDYTGWLHLLRAVLTLLLPDECDGQAQPIRITQIKQRLGVLVIHHVGRTTLRRGVCELVERISGHTCMKCDHPGRPRGGWIASAVIVTAVETVPQVFTLDIRTEDCDCRAHGRSLPSRDRAPGIVGFQLGQSGVRPDVRECPGLARVRLDTGHVTCMRAGSHS